MCTELKLASLGWTGNLKPTHKVISLQHCIGFRQLADWFMYNPTSFYNNFTDFRHLQCFYGGIFYKLKSGLKINTGTKEEPRYMGHRIL